MYNYVQLKNGNPHVFHDISSQILQTVQVNQLILYIQYKCSSGELGQAYFSE